MTWASTNVKADYLVKADDMTSLLPNQLERRLRLLPRERTLWGYPLEGERIQSDTWAASMDLIRTTASSNLGSQTGNEQAALDALVRTWFAPSTGSSSASFSASGSGTVTGLTLSSERCWMYDYPLSHTVHAHGYLLPGDVQQIKSEVRYGLPAPEMQKRGGSQWYLSYSSVVDHTRSSRPLRIDRKAQVHSLNSLERVSALFEGNGSASSTGEGGTIAVRHVRSDFAWYETMLALQGPH